MKRFFTAGAAVIGAGVAAAGAYKGYTDAKAAGQEFSQKHVTKGVQDVLIGGAVLGLGAAEMALKSVSTVSEIVAPPAEEKIAAPEPAPASATEPAPASSPTSDFGKTVATAAANGAAKVAGRHAAAAVLDGTDNAADSVDVAENLSDVADVADAVDGDTLSSVGEFLAGCFGG